MTVELQKKTSTFPLIYQEASTELGALETLNLAIDEELRIRRERVVENAVINANSVALKYDPKSQVDVLNELSRHSYAKVVVLQDDNNRLHRYRVTQANKSIIKGKNGELINIINRLAPLAGKLITAELEDKIECNGKFFGYVKLVEYVKKSTINQNDFSSFELIENDEDYDLRDKKLTNIRASISSFGSLETEDLTADHIEPSTHVIAINSEDQASLSAEFYTRTTKEQEELIQFPNNGVMLIMGVAGSGKTSVALGRVKKLRDCSYSSPDDENYDDFFKETHRMVGFVLHKQLVPYLKETCSNTGLELSSMPVKEYKELQQALLTKYQSVLQLQMTADSKGKYKRANKPYSFSQQTKISWLREIEKLVATNILDEIIISIRKADADFLDYKMPEHLNGKRAERLKSLILNTWQTFSANWLKELEKRKLKKGKWDFSTIGLINDLHLIYAEWNALFETDRPFYDDNGRFSHKSNSPLAERFYPFGSANADSDTVKALGDLRRQLRQKVRSIFKLSSSGSQLRLTDIYLSAMHSIALDDNSYGLDIDKGIEILQSERLTDADLDTLLAIVSLITWKATNDDIPEYLQENYKYTSVFIDEIQDFSELQAFNMGLQADSKRHAITAVGDFKQQLYADTISDLPSCFPMMTQKEPHPLTKNMRQLPVLARYSQFIRDSIEGNAVDENLINWDSKELKRFYVEEAELIRTLEQHLQNIGQNKSVAVICPTYAIAESLEKQLRNTILENFRESHVSQHSNELNKPFYIHFTTPKPTKGLEFDIVFIPYYNEFNIDDHLEANHQYVAVSRPKERLILINVE